MAKLVAGRDKDLTFAAAAIRAGLARSEVLHERLEQTEVPTALRAVVAGRIEAAGGSAR